MDSELWKEVEQNPVLFLERINYEKLVALAHDENFVYKMDAVYSAFKKYVDVEPDHQRPSIAYFSMEYGLDEVLKIYSGGLGMLAGDYLKEASDSNVDLCAIGLLYRYGYFDQSLSMDGQQTVNYKAQNFGQLPIEKVMQPDGKQLVIHVPMPTVLWYMPMSGKPVWGVFPFICWIRTMNSTASLTALSLTICMEATGRIG